MKKMLVLTAAFAVIFAMGLSCEKPPDEGNFSLVAVGDTVFTVDNVGLDHNFGFTLKNNTTTDLPLVIDCPASLQALPQDWYTLMCDTGQCYPLPCTTQTLKANDSILGFHVTIGSLTGGTEGKVVLTVASGEEVDSQAFILKIAE